MTVAVTEAAVVNSAAKKVKIAIGKAAQREYTDKGVRKTRVAERQAPVRKRPNITCEAILMRFKISLILAGSATVNPPLVNVKGFDIGATHLMRLREAHCVKFEQG